jgi:predicted Na+-dependent transporter
MNTAEFLALLAQLAGLTFVVTGMLAMGLSLTIQQILQPLRNVRLMVLALLANFVLVPLLAYIIAIVLNLSDPLRIGLILLSTAAGAPFLPKLVQSAKGSVALGVGLMVLLMVVTIGYMPLVLPLLLPGVQINAWDIAKSLIVLMLVPLAIGLMIRANDAEAAASYQPTMAKASSLALLVLMIVGLGLNLNSILDLIGTGGIIAVLLFVVGAFVTGFVLGGNGAGTRSVLGLGTAQRNISAALVVAAQNFSDNGTLSFVLAAALILLLILLPTSKRLGMRAQASAPSETAKPVA